jgi:hypothetical protein
MMPVGKFCHQPGAATAPVHPEHGRRRRRDKGAETCILAILRESTAHVGADTFWLGLQLWDTRKQDAIRQYTHHFDFISDMLWLDDKKQLVSTRCVCLILMCLPYRKLIDV